MKRFFIYGFVIIILFIATITVGVSEESFEEASFDAVPLEEEFFFSEESFFADDAFAIELGSDDNHTPENASEIEDRSYATLELELSNLTEEEIASLNSWQTAPTLIAESQKSAGSVKLSWVQNGIQALDKDVKYYVYSVNPVTGASWQVGNAVAAAKKPLTIDGATGVGASVILKKQTTGTEYFVRAEKAAKLDKKAVGNAEEYGLSSNHVFYTGDDETWKTIKDLGVTINGLRHVVVEWYCSNAFVDASNGYKIERTVWQGKEKTTTPIALVLDKTYWDEDEGEFIGEFGNFLADSYNNRQRCLLSDDLPEGTTKFQYKVTAIRNNATGKAVTSKKVNLENEAWKTAYALHAKQIGSGPSVKVIWYPEHRIADHYDFNGFASSAAIEFNNEGYFWPVFDKKGNTPIESIEYQLYWDIDEKQYNVQVIVAKDMNGIWTADIEDGDAEAVQHMPEILTASFVYGNISVTGTVKEDMKASISVTPKLNGKKGVKSIASCDLEALWKYPPELYYPIQEGDRLVSLNIRFNDPKLGDKYTISGFAGSVTAEFAIADEDDWDYGIEAGDYYLKLTDPNNVIEYADVYVDHMDSDEEEEGLLYAGVYILGEVKKTGKASFTAQVKRTVNGKTLSGKKSEKATITVLAGNQKSSVVGSYFWKSTEWDEKTDEEKNYLKLSFFNMNPRAESFRISVVDQPGHMNEGQERYSTLFQFNLDDLNFDDDRSVWYNEDESVIGYPYVDGTSYSVKFELPEGSEADWFVGIIETILDDGTRILNTALGNSYTEY